MLTQNEKENIFDSVFELQRIFGEKKDDEHIKFVKKLVNIVDREFLFLVGPQDKKNYWNSTRYNHLIVEIDRMLQVGSPSVYQRLGKEVFNKREIHTFDFFDDIISIPDVGEHQKICSCLKIIKEFITEIDYHKGLMSAGKDHKEALRRFLLEDFQSSLDHFWICQSVKKSSSDNPTAKESR